jgi:signal transduction histidine kinase
MRLARKFTTAFLVGMCLVLMLLAWLTARREIALFENDMKRDHTTLGHVLATAAQQIWSTYDEAAAQKFVKAADATRDQVRIRWIALDAPAADHRAKAPAETVREAQRAGSAVWIDRTEKEGRLYTYVPLPSSRNRAAVLELSESLHEERAYVRTTLIRILVTTGVIVALCGALAMLLGYRLVGRPVHSLVEKARRAGSGDFAGRLELRGHDELSELGGALNAMCDQLAQSLEQLRRADRLLTVGKLAAGIAHELGTPLNVVRARAKMMMVQDGADAQTAGGARVIVEQSDQMTKIIRQLLDFARPRPPQKLEVDLCHVARRTLSLLETIAHKRSVRLQLEGCEAPVPATVDPDQLQQVLSNLVVNSMQAMPEGGAVTVQVGREQARPSAERGGPPGRFAFLRVRDQGVGIPPESLAHLFEPFFTTKDVGEGTGLGLSVSRGIIREHDGWIDVQSQVGEGSCFTVYLPLT